MYYVFYSTKGKYQICTFNPYTYSGWNSDLSTCMRDELRTATHNTRPTSAESRIAEFNLAWEPDNVTCSLVVQVSTLADLPNLYPELFI